MKEYALRAAVLGSGLGPANNGSSGLGSGNLTALGYQWLNITS